MLHVWNPVNEELLQNSDMIIPNKVKLKFLVNGVWKLILSLVILFLLSIIIQSSTTCKKKDEGYSVSKGLRFQYCTKKAMTNKKSTYKKPQHTTITTTTKKTHHPKTKN